MRTTRAPPRQLLFPRQTHVQVYYAPRLAFTQAVTLPTLFGGFRLLRCILLRERINLVHGHQVGCACVPGTQSVAMHLRSHCLMQVGRQAVVALLGVHPCQSSLPWQAFSTMAHEAIMHARTMGYRVVFTDHSLFGFADASSILVNKAGWGWDVAGLGMTPGRVLWLQLKCATAPRWRPHRPPAPLCLHAHSSDAERRPFACGWDAGAQVHAGRCAPRDLREPHLQGARGAGCSS